MTAGILVIPVHCNVLLSSQFLVGYPKPSGHIGRDCGNSTPVFGREPLSDRISSVMACTLVELNMCYGSRRLCDCCLSSAITAGIVGGSPTGDQTRSRNDVVPIGSRQANGSP